MRTRMYGGVSGRKTKVGRKLSFSSYSIYQLIRQNMLQKWAQRKKSVDLHFTIHKFRSGCHSG